MHSKMAKLVIFTTHTLLGKLTKFFTGSNAYHVAWLCEKENKLYVDHNHKTDRVRGLLCMNCNSALGHLNEDLTIIKKAIEYIENNNKIDEKISINPENNGNPTN